MHDNVAKTLTEMRGAFQLAQCKHEGGDAVSSPDETILWNQWLGTLAPMVARMIPMALMLLPYLRMTIALSRC